jgi:SNF2 family DNA or RNA helicase
LEQPFVNKTIKPQAILMAQHALVSMLQGNHEISLQSSDTFTKCLLPIKSNATTRKKIRKSYSAQDKYNQKPKLWSLEPEGLFVILLYYAWKNMKEAQRLFKEIQHKIDPYLLGCAPLNELIYANEGYTGTHSFNKTYSKSSKSQHSLNLSSTHDNKDQDLFDLFAPVAHESTQTQTHLIGSWNDLGHPFNLLWVAWSVRIHQLPLDQKQVEVLHQHTVLAQKAGYHWLSQQLSALAQDDAQSFELEVKTKGRVRGITWGQQKWNVFTQQEDLLAYDWEDELKEDESELEEKSPLDLQYARHNQTLSFNSLEHDSIQLPTKVKKAQKLKKQVSDQVRMIWIVHTKDLNTRKKHTMIPLGEFLYTWSNIQITARLQLKRKRTWTQGRKLKLNEILVQKNVPIWVHALDYQIAETCQKLEDYSDESSTKTSKKYIILELTSLLQKHKHVYWGQYQSQPLIMSYASHNLVVQTQPQTSQLSYHLSINVPSTSIAKHDQDLITTLGISSKNDTSFDEDHHLYLHSRYQQDELCLYTTHESCKALVSEDFIHAIKSPINLAHHDQWSQLLENAMTLEFDHHVLWDPLPNHVVRQALPIHLVALCEYQEMTQKQWVHTDHEKVLSLTLCLWIDETLASHCTHTGLIDHTTVIGSNQSKRKKLNGKKKNDTEYQSIRGQAIRIAEGSHSIIFRSFVAKSRLQQDTDTIKSSLLHSQDLCIDRDFSLEQKYLADALQELPYLKVLIDEHTKNLTKDTSASSYQVYPYQLQLDLYQALSMIHEMQNNHSIAIVWNHRSAQQIIMVSPSLDIQNLSLDVECNDQQLALKALLKKNDDHEDKVAFDLSLNNVQQQLLHTKSEGSLLDHAPPFLALGDGKFLTLTQELRMHLEQLGRFQHSFKEDLKNNKPYLDILLADLYHSQNDQPGATHWKQVWDTLRPNETLEHGNIKVNKDLKATLRSYQQSGLAWLSHRLQHGVGCCLADDMGLGKTLQALALLLDRHQHGPTLIVAPTSLCGVWEKEAQKFASILNIIRFAESDRAKVINALMDRQKKDNEIKESKEKEKLLNKTKTKKMSSWPVLVCSYGLLSMCIEQLKQVEWHSLIFDEAQALKNASTKRYQAAQKLTANAKIAITGTPIENHLKDIWSLFNLLNPGLLGNRKRFHEKWSLPIEAGDQQAMKHLHLLLQPFILRRSKQEVLSELPPRTNISIPIELGPEERAHYEALRLGSIQKAQQKQHQSIHILAQLTQLRRACCHPQLVSPELGISSAKIIAFKRLITDLKAGGHRVLVFSQFVDYLKLIRAWLNEENWEYQYLDGSTSARMRDKSVQAFQNGEGDLFLISLKAGGFGLTLTQADFVIHMDPWWNPAVEDQASDRAHRIGQTRPVTVYRLVTMGTIEEKVMSLHQSKRNLANQLLSAQVEKSLSSDDLMSLLNDA